MSSQCSDCATSRRSVNLGRHARRLLRQLHLWIGLALCLPMVVVGLTGSILVYRNELTALLNPPPRLTCATGKAHAVADIVETVQARIGKEFKPFLYEPPGGPGRPASVRFIALEGVAAGPRVIEVMVDPVSLDFVRQNYNAFPGLLGTVVRLHANLLIESGGAGVRGLAWRRHAGARHQWLHPVVASVESVARSLRHQARRTRTAPSIATCTAQSASGPMSCSSR